MIAAPKPKAKRKRFKPGPMSKTIPGEAPPQSDNMKHEVYQLYLMGWKAPELAALAKEPVGKIYNWISAGRWNERKDYYDRLNSKKNPEKAQPIVRAVIQANRDGMREKFKEISGQIALEDIEDWSKLTPKERREEAAAIVPLNKMHRDNIELNKDSEAGTGSHISLTFLSQADTPGMVTVIDAPTETQRIENTP